jgi:DNA-binding SARP family transcriptional activator
MDTALLSISLFGPFEVRVRGQPLPQLRSRSVEWLLALMALRHGRPVSRPALAATLWPESRQERALLNLRGSLVELRRALGEAAFAAAWAAGRAMTLEQAVEYAREGAL